MAIDIHRYTQIHTSHIRSIIGAHASLSQQKVNLSARPSTRMLIWFRGSIVDSISENNTYSVHQNKKAITIEYH